MLAIMSRELVDAEGHYHRSCYRFIHKGKTDTTSGEQDDDVAGER